MMNIATERNGLYIVSFLTFLLLLSVVEVLCQDKK